VVALDNFSLLFDNGWIKINHIHGQKPTFEVISEEEYSALELICNQSSPYIVGLESNNQYGNHPPMTHL
jgi:hypothetical protein